MPHSTLQGPPAPDSPLESVLGPAAGPRSARTVRFSFGALVVTQFLGALNDNVLKQFLALQLAIGGLWHGQFGDGATGIVGFAFAAPFILFSGMAGEIADRWSKRWLSVVLKTVEIPIVCLAGIGIYYQSLWITLTSMVLLEVHSACFGPAKYGMIPEIVPGKRLARANGTVGLTTNLATIGGMLLGGSASNAMHVQNSGTPPDLHLCFKILLGVALLGRVSVQFIQPLEARNPTQRIHFNPLHSYLLSFRLMWGSRSLSRSVFGWALFYVAAIAVMSAIPELKEGLTVNGLPANDNDLTWLNASLGVAVGVGSMAAGYTARGRLSKTPVLAGGAGLALALAAFPLVPMTFLPLLLLLSAAGTAAGFFLVPLMTYIQAAAPDATRGQFLGTTNFLSFVALGLGGLMYTLLRKFHLSPPQVLGACGVGFLGVLYLMRDINLQADVIEAAEPQGTPPA